MRRNILSVFMIVLGAVILNAQTSGNPLQTSPSELVRSYFKDGKFEMVLNMLRGISEVKKNGIESDRPANQILQKEEADFYVLASDAMLKHDSFQDEAKEFLLNYPVSQYSSRVYLLLSVFASDAAQYSASLSWLNQVKESSLDNEEMARYLFYKGYAYLHTERLEKARNFMDKARAYDFEMKSDALFYYAYSCYAMGDFQEARSHFKALEARAPFNTLIPYYYVQIWFQEGKTDSVKAYANGLLEAFPQNSMNGELYRILGELAYSDKQYTKAEQLLQKYMNGTDDPRRSALFAMGLSCYELNKFDDVIKYLRKVTGISDKTTETAYLFLGNSYLKLNDKDNARLAFEAALGTRFDKNVREKALFNYALTSYETTTAFGEAITGFENFLTEFPQSRYADQAQNYLATELMTSRNYEKSYQSVMKISNPNQKMLDTRQYILYQLGTNAFSAQQFTKAIDYFTRSIQSSKTGKYGAESMYWRSECYYRQNQQSKSINDILDFFDHPASKESVNFIKAHYGMGYAYFSRREYDQAAKWFGLYLQKNFNRRSAVYADALNRLADCQYALRDFKDAELSYLDAVNASPNTGDYALFQSAYVSGVMKNYATKISRLSRLLTNYPNSEYLDDAMYEMGRAYIMLNNDNDAINIYRQLLKKKPNSPLARKAALEIAMSLANRGNTKEAIDAYKDVIKDYPGSDEAYTSLESLENLYIEINDVKTFLTYSKSLNLSMSGNIINREDSISYIAAERQYMNGNYKEAIQGLHSYLKQYCSGGRYCTSSLYYLADSYYHNNEMNSALEMYKELLSISGNQYLETAALRSAQISYDQKNFVEASKFFARLKEYAQGTENLQKAELGILRSNVQLNNNAQVILSSGKILDDPKASQEILEEARYSRAKAQLALSNNQAALEDLKLLAENTRTNMGAESKYLLARTYFEMKDLKQSENEIMDFAKKNTPYPYWLARSFVLISDIYLKLENPFQAKQFLLSLRKNYTVQDDIQTMISERLDKIQAVEKKK